MAEIFSILGSAITLIGVAFVLILPSDGVLSPTARTAVAAVLAAAAVGVALWQHARDAANIGAQALMATGIASAFLCVLANTVFFVDAAGRGRLPTVLGLVLAGLISVGGVWVARLWRSEWLAVVAVLGSLLLAPWIGRADVAWALAFMVVLTLVTAVFQRDRSWLWLMGARFIPTSLIFAWLLLDSPSAPGFDSWIPLILAVVLAAGGLALGALHQRGPRGEQVAAAAYVVVSALPVTVASWSADRPVATAVCALLGLAYLAVSLLGDLFSETLRSVATPLGALFVMFALLRATDDAYLGHVVLGLAAAYFALALSTRFRPIGWVAGALGIIGVLRWLPLLGTLADPWSASASGLAGIIETLLALAVALLAARALRVFGARGSWLSYGAWAAAVAFGSVAVVLAGASLGAATGRGAVGFQTAHALVTVAWLVLCIVLLRLGLRAEADPLVPVRIAIALAVAAVAKLFLFDLATLPGLVRALAFLAVGVLLLVIGTWYARQLERARRRRTGAEPAAGHDPAAFWEERYASRPQVWSGRPNQPLVDLAGAWPPGRALDLGCGEGADTVWLASRGWSVTAVDVSATAIARGRRAAAAQGLAEDRIRWVAHDLMTWTDASTYDLVSACFLHSPMALDRTRILRSAAGAVARGGHLLVVSHATPPTGAPGGEHGDHPDQAGHGGALSPDDELAALALPPQDWEVVVAELRSRVGGMVDGTSPADTVVLLRRR